MVLDTGFGRPTPLRPARPARRPAREAPAPYAVARPPGENEGDMPASASAIIGGFLRQFGLEGLSAWAWKRYKELGGGESAMGIIEFEMVEQDDFKARFPSYQSLRQQGSAWSPAQIIAYEDFALGQLNSVGGDTMYSRQEIQGWLAAGVSQNEVAERIGVARRAATAPSETTAALRDMYGLDDQMLARFWLDPDRALPQIEQAYAAGELGGAAVRSTFGALDRGEAERLASVGVTREQAGETFGALAEQSGLFDANVAGEEQIGRSEQLAAGFENNAAARARIERKRRGRQGQFEGGSGFGVGREGVIGLGG